MTRRTNIARLAARCMPLICADPRLSGALTRFNPPCTAQNAEGVEPASTSTIPESAAGTITVPVRTDTGSEGGFEAMTHRLSITTLAAANVSLAHALAARVYPPIFGPRLAGRKS